MFIRKIIPLAALLLLMTGASSISLADDTLVISEDQESIISGTVIDNDFDRLVIESNGEEIYVDVDDLDIEEDLSDFLPIGAEIQVYGDLDDGTIDAKRIVYSE